jgi:hypothetical protein
MALFNPRLTKTNQFVKSSFKDLQDPVFLTFDVDFFPVAEQFPRYDGLQNNNLLRMPWGSTAAQLMVQDSKGRVGFTGGDNPNNEVEYGAYDWLHDYYGSKYTAGQLNRSQPHPGTALGRVIGGLAALQSSPWYFQSVSGVGDLWKQSQRVKEGNMKATLTFSCLESIRQPLTDIAENYRYAVYDSDRLSYRLPDNLRWFDMDIRLLEGRNLTDNKEASGPFSVFKSIFRDNSLDLFVKDSFGTVVSGIKVIKFKCKMCEFDFNDFLTGTGGTGDFSAVIPDSPFKPTFKVNVGWVIQEEVLDEDVEDIRQSNLLTGVFDALSNKLSSTLSNIASIPGELIDATTNRLQTKLEGLALGNIYTGAGFTTLNRRINDLQADALDFVSGRSSPVGPNNRFKIGDNALTPANPAKKVETGELGSSYEKPGPPKGTPEIGDTPGYSAQPASQVNNIDNTYEPPARQEEQTFGGAVYTEDLQVEDVQDIGLSYNPPPATPAQSGEIDDTYQEQLTVSPIATIGKAYQTQPVVGPVGDIGDLYADQPDPAQVSDLGDTYPDEAGPAQVSDLGDTYPDQPKPNAVGSLGDSYPEERGPAQVGNIGNTYPTEGGPNLVGSIGDTYPGESEGPPVGAIGDAYTEGDGGQPTSNLGDVYPDGGGIQQTGNMGDVYPDEGGSDPASNLGDAYQ